MIGSRMAAGSPISRSTAFARTRLHPIAGLRAGTGAWQGGRARGRPMPAGGNGRSCGWASEEALLVEDREVVITDAMHVRCDGAGGALGHPGVHDAGEGRQAVCQYCGRRYVHVSHAEAEQIPRRQPAFRRLRLTSRGTGRRRPDCRQDSPGPRRGS